MPQPAQFNPAFLSGQARELDLSPFTRGNPVIAGIYRVDLYVNGAWRDRRDLNFESDGQGSARVCMTMAMLEELGVDTRSLPEAAGGQEGCRPLQDWVPDAFASFDSSTLRYELSIPQAFLRRSARGYVNPAVWDRGINAGLLSYGFNAVDNVSRGNGRSDSVYLALDAGLNLAGWQLHHNASFNWRDSDGARWQRLNTYAQRGLPRLRGLLTIGESYTNGELFDSVGLLGVSLSSDDRMLPDSLLGYAPTVRGIAETNARVEVRQNRQLIYSTPVAPGNFVIDDLYPTGYGGDLEVTVLEADGRRRRFSVPYAAVAQMLRPGVSRYALSAGRLRGEDLPGRPWLLQGTYQRGIGNQLTLYGGGMLSEDYGALLLGAGWSTRLGALAADLTQARAEVRGATRAGSSLRLSYSKIFAPTRTQLAVAAYRHSAQGYYSLRDAFYARRVLDIAQASGVPRRPRNQFQLTLNQPFGQRLGVLYATGSARDFWDGGRRGVEYQMGYNNSWGRLSYSLSAVRSQDPLGRRETQYLISFSLPLGRGERGMSLSGDVGLDGRSGYDRTRVGLSGWAGREQGVGYSLALSDSRDGQTSASASAEYRTRYVSLSSAYARSSLFRQASVGAAGTLLAHAGGISFAPERGETMVLIEAPAARDARVANLPGLRIDGRGYAVVPYVAPYRMNTITLDPNGMSQDVELQGSSQSVAPFAGAVSRLRFETRRGRALLISLRNAGARQPPFGAQVKDGRGQPVGLVGQGGHIYVRSDLAQDRLTVKWGSLPEQSCTMDYAIAPGSQPGPSGMLSLEAECQ